MPGGRPPGLPELPLGETPARVARARQKGIRAKFLRFLESRPGIQAIRGGRRRIGNDFRHERGSGAKEPDYIGS
jgi:hypothetical protein